jgi:c-di-GMP-binding flagellar brake protein YcgR
MKRMQILPSLQEFAVRGILRMFSFIKKIFGFTGAEKEKPEGITNLPLTLTEGNRLTVKDRDSVIADRWEGIITKTTRPSFRIQVFSYDKKPDFMDKKEVFITIVKDEKTAKFSTTIINYTDEGLKYFLDLEYPREVEWSYVRKRLHERLKTKISSKIRSELSKNGPWDKVKLIDISTGGVGFLSPRPFNISERVTINFLYPYLPSKVSGIIRRVTTADKQVEKGFKYQLGIEFSNLTSKDIEQISRVCASLKKR